MSAFFGYIQNITYYLLFAAIAGMIAPAGKYKKFVSLVMGFILLAMVIAPLSRLGTGERFDPANWLAGIIPASGAASWDEERLQEQWLGIHLAEAFEAQLEVQLEALLNAQGIQLHAAAFAYTDDFSRITRVRAVISREQAPQRVPFIRIEPVQVGPRPYEPCALSTEARNLIAGFYNLPITHIDIEVRH